VVRDSITILKGKPKVFVNRDKNKNTIFFASPAENSKPPSGGTITTDRCLTHIRDAAHSESRSLPCSNLVHLSVKALISASASPEIPGKREQNFYKQVLLVATTPQKNMLVDTGKSEVFGGQYNQCWGEIDFLVYSDDENSRVSLKLQS